MFDRIVADPQVLGGKPCVKGTRISVEFLLELAASGASRDQILRHYPQLTATDIEQAFLFAGRSLQNDGVISLAVAP